MEKAIVVRGVCKKFGPAEVLREVSFEIDRGSMVALIGPSGSGKTTILRIINGFITPDRGDVYVDGEKLGRANVRKIRKKVGMVYQLFNLVERLTVLQNVLVGALGRYDGIFTGILPTLGFFPKAEIEKAYELLNFVGLYDKAHERVDRLSGGQKQRVAIARALMQEPTILLADEPIANLDPKTGRLVMDIFYRINSQRGITIICVLHHIDYLKDYFYRAIGLSEGRVVFDGLVSSISDDMLKRLYSSDGDYEGWFSQPKEMTLELSLLS